MQMRFWTIAALTAGCAAGALFFVGTPAEAAKRKQVDFLSSQSQRIVTQPRSRVTVRRPRSYLDAGTEVLPGERKYNDYAIPYGYSAIDSALGPSNSWDRRPFNNPFDVPGRGF
jgi:hypothetical protein